MKLLLVISADWYFCSHRLPIAVAAVKQGWSVHHVAMKPCLYGSLAVSGAR